MNIFQGVTASSGVAFGNAFVIPKLERPKIEKRIISSSEIDESWLKFERARNETIAYFESLITTKDSDQNEIFTTYVLMLSDPDFISQVKLFFTESLFNIEYVLQLKVNEFADKLRLSGDPYLTERASDIVDVYEKVLDKLTNYILFSFNQIPPNSVLVAESLSPSDSYILSKYSISALVLHEGGLNSHLSILARTYGIPLVFGIENISSRISNNDFLIVDGIQGKVFTHPDEETINNYKIKLSKEASYKAELAKFTKRSAITADGTSISIFANIGTVEEAKYALECGASGIGLFRTEFLFMNKMSSNTHSLFSEEEQFLAYKEVLTMFGDKPVTIRTLDAGGDKIIKAEGMPSGNEKNPLLGWRAIRFCLDRTDIFKTQLRALLRAGVYGNLKIMIPLLTDLSQLIVTKKLIQEAMAELKNDKIPFNPHIPLGIMVETPAAAIMADVLAINCDFFSIGSNDLTQYTLCVDREDSIVASLFTELHPSVLRLIKYTVLSANQNGIPISVCGEMASDPITMTLLLGYGIKILSMSPSKINTAKEFLSKINYTDIKAVTEQTALLSSASDIKHMISDFINK